MATVHSYTKTGVDRKFQARSPVTIAYAGTGTPELAAFPDAKSGDVIEREGDRARWRVVGNQLTALPGSVTSVNGNSGIVTLSAQDLGAASSSHTHTKSQITDLEPISTGATADHIVKRINSGDITVPATPNANTSAASKSYVDTQISTLASSSHTHTKSQITDLEVISTGATANHIVKRTSAAQVEVPLTPTLDAHATSKKYVDAAMADAAVGDHRHDIADVNLLQGELDKKAEKTYVDSQISTRAASSHTHTKSQITDLEVISTNATVNHLVKRTTSGNITVPATPNAETSAASKNYVDNQVNTRATSSHTHTKSQITDLEIVSTDVTLNHIVKRTTSGNISVPTTPNANTSATSKSYVDTEVGKKANTSHTHSKADITDLEPISSSLLSGHVPIRTASGNLIVPTTPNGSSAAASKSYVDNATPWSGTRTQYNALTNKDPNRLYIITGA